MALSGATAQVSSRAACGVAFRPVVDIQERKPIAYEALARAARRAADRVAVIDVALSSAHLVSPAILLVSLPQDVLLDPSFDPVAHGRAAGMPPGEVAWVLHESGTPEVRAAARGRAVQLAAEGYLIALEGVGLAALGQQATAELQPSFVILEHRLTAHLAADERARAELAGLLAFYGRLGSRVVARGVDDESTGRILMELGMQLGVGELLGKPVVVDANLAEPGDEVVTELWFRQRGVRVLSPRSELGASDTRIFTEFPEPTPGNGEVGDRDFARTLGEAARLLQAEHDPANILAVVADLLPKVLPADRLAIFEADWDNHRLRPRLAIGEGMDGLFDMDDSMGTGITGGAFLRGLPFNCPDTSTQPEAAAVPGTPAEGGESLLVIPLIAGDHRLGALDIWRDGPGQFSDDDVERAALFGYITAAAWRNAQLYGELEQRAMTDTLTGLLNRRWWNELAPREAAQSLRGGAEIGVLMVDLDHFKDVNDEAGHSTGDLVLRNVAGVLRNALRSGDAAVRSGGEEFLLVLRDSDTDGSRRVAESVREGLAALPPPRKGLPTVTASIGIAFYPRHGSELEEVVRAADMAMYQAKADGRDRIRFAPDPGGWDSA